MQANESRLVVGIILANHQMLTFRKGRSPRKWSSHPRMFQGGVLGAENHHKESRLVTAIAGAKNDIRELKSGRFRQMVEHLVGGGGAHPERNCTSQGIYQVVHRH